MTEICGFQKLTLLDYPEHTACTVFLNGCNMRCPFCHNFELAEGKGYSVITEKDFFEFLDKRKGLLDGVAITGGEPSLSQGLPDLVRKIRSEGFKVKLDTNGLNPDVTGSLLDEGLPDYISMDIKNSPGKYPRTAGIDKVDMDRIRRSIDIIMNRAPDYEFRTTVVSELHEENDFREMGEMIKGAKRYCLQRFIRSDHVPDPDLSSPSPEELEKYAEIMSSYVKEVRIRGVDL